MRKGFSLVEVLVVLAVLSLLSVPLAKLTTTTVRDIPRAYQIIQVNTSLLSMLSQMHKDIDAAKGLPESFEQYRTNNELLLIESEDGMVCYQLKESKVLRCMLATAKQDAGEDTVAWSVPNAKVEWQVWRQDKRGYAVEVKTYIEYKVEGRLQKKMANSHLYFMCAFREAPR